VTVFELDAPTLEIGEKLLVLWSERLKVSRDSNSYPPYAQNVVPLSAPEDFELNYGEDA
jgi:hypothetical protein